MTDVTKNAPSLLPEQLAILDRARQELPAPFAPLAAELLFELSTSSPDWGRVFLLQIDLFEASVAFLSFLLLAQLATPNQRILESASSIAKLREDGTKLSTGHWWGLLRAASCDVARAGSPPLEPARLASALYFGDASRASGGDGSGIAKLLDAVPNLRNRVKGHAWTLPPEQYEQHARTLLDTTARFVGALDGFRRCSLFVVAHCSAAGDGFDLDLRVLRGDGRRPIRRSLRAKGPLAADRVYVASDPDLDAGSLDPARALCLHPFVQLRRSDDGFEGIFVAQGIGPKALDLASAVGGHRLACAGSAPEALRLLDALLAGANQPAKSFEALRTRASELARTLLASPAARASYDPRSYLVRPRVAQQLEAPHATADAAPTADEGAPARANGTGTALWIVSGPSGSGKTALCCHAAERWLLGARSDDIVVVVLPTELVAAGGTLLGWWQQRFTQPLLEACAAAQTAGATLRIFLDSLDRLGPIDSLVAELIDLLHSPKAAPLRFFVTATEAMAERLAVALRRTDVAARVRRWSIPNLTAAEAEQLYRLLADDPSADQPRLDPAVLGLLGSPLLVRLARDLDAVDTASGLTPGRLLRAHAERTVLADPVRAHVAQHVAAAIARSERKHVPLSALFDDPNVRSALLASGEDAPLRALVRGHVLILDRSPAGTALPTPSEPMLSFAFDAQLDFLIFANLVRELGPDLAAWGPSLAGRGPFAPLVGALRILFVESLRTGAHEIGALVELLAGLLADTRSALIGELLAAGVDCAEGSRLDALVTEVLGRIGPSASEEIGRLGAEAFQRLVTAGRVEEAIATARLVGRHAPGAATLPLRAEGVRLEAWSTSAASAVTWGAELLREAAALGADAQTVAIDALLEATWLHGPAGDARTLSAALDAMGSTSDPPTHLAIALAALRRSIAEGDPCAWEADLARARACASAAGSDARALARVVIDAADRLGARHLPDGARCLELAREAVELAGAIGDALLEARACEAVAHALPQDADQQLLWVERGLLAADTTIARGPRARLLIRRARVRIAQGRFAEASADATEAARLFDEAGHRADAMRARLHVQFVAKRALGVPGENDRVLREVGRQADELGERFEQALITLLRAGIACDLGRVDEARGLLDRLEELRAVAPTETASICPDLVRGRLALVAGDLATATRHLEAAYEWGKARSFADLVYAPPVSLARAELSVSAEAGGEARWASALRRMQDVLAAAPKFGQLDRYAGEVYTQFARALWRTGQLEQAKTWADKAETWFESRPNHLRAPELHALLALLTIATGATGAKPAKGAEAVRLRALGLATRARALVRQQGESFAGAEDRAAFYRAHAANEMLAGEPMLAEASART